MKTKIFVILLIFLTSYVSAQQQEFIIGADWLKNRTIESANDCLSSAEWDRIQELGLKYGRILISNNDYNSDLNSIINNTFNDAASRGIKIFFSRYNSNFGYNLNPYCDGQRWRYHPEFSGHYPIGDRVGEPYNDMNIDTEKDADQPDYPIII